MSSVRLLTQKQPNQIPSSFSFGFGSSASQAAQAQSLPAPAPVFKQLNCSIIVVAPKAHGLLVTVNSYGLPKNLTKLGITLNHDSSHAQHINFEGAQTSANYLLTQPGSSKTAINLQSFQPIDWSHVSFDILFTVYKKANSTNGCPNKKWFDCGDNICVPSSLVCDNNKNCPNGNDEMIFYRCYSPLFWSIAASTTCAMLIVILIVAVILFSRKRRNSRLNKMKQLSLSTDDNNVLTSDQDLINGNDTSSKLDLTQTEQQLHPHHQQIADLRAKNQSSYLANNLYLGGFENPVWQNGTLTKQQQQLQQK